MSRRAFILGSSPAMLAGVAAHRAILDDPAVGQEMQKTEVAKQDAGLPPRRLSSTLGHPSYRPDALRVGVRINGEEATTCIYYDVDLKAYRVQGDNEHQTRIAESIEPYWRYPETRQLRRARERWESKRK